MPIAADDAATDTEAKKDTVDVYVWAQDIPQGTSLAKKHVKTVSVKRDNLPSNVIVDINDIISNYAKRDLYAEEYASADQMSSTEVSKVNKDVLKKDINTSGDKYLYVTDYIIPNTGDDLAPFLQEIIDKNPNRTIYFPDGEYVIETALKTSAVGKQSVSIQLSDGAVIKASNNWKSRDGSAMISLGGGGDMNNIVNLGSYYILSGGTLDGNNRANCISVDSGRESVIRNICLKNPKKGIYIAPGVNGNSADIDMEDITIIGNGMPGTVGIDSVGYDNTYTNIRIYDMEKGLINAGGDVTGVYIVNTEKSAKLNTVGVTGPWRMANCVTVNCDVAYMLTQTSLVFDCVSTWTSAEHKTQTTFSTKTKNLISGSKAYFFDGEGVNCKFVTDYPEGKEPVIEGCFIIK
jgi:hypothetical protein